MNKPSLTLICLTAPTVILRKLMRSEPANDDLLCLKKLCFEVMTAFSSSRRSDSSHKSSIANVAHGSGSYTNKRASSSTQYIFTTSQPLTVSLWRQEKNRSLYKWEETCKSQNEVPHPSAKKETEKWQLHLVYHARAKRPSQRKCAVCTAHNHLQGIQEP